MVMPKCAKVVSQLTSVVEYVLQKEKGYRYECDMLSLFELGSVHHDYYLVNIKVPVEPYSDVNMKIGKLEDMSLVVLTFRTIIKSVQWIVHLTLNRSVLSLSPHQTLLLFSWAWNITLIALHCWVPGTDSSVIYINKLKLLVSQSYENKLV